MFFMKQVSVPSVLPLQKEIELGRQPLLQQRQPTCFIGTKQEVKPV
jgi:hypothetical protein